VLATDARESVDGRAAHGGRQRRAVEAPTAARRARDRSRWAIVRAWNRLLSEAGFRDVALAPFTPKLVVGGGGDLDATVEFVLQLGALSAIWRTRPTPWHECAQPCVRGSHPTRPKMES
jgi:hypothetical protein